MRWGRAQWIFAEHFPAFGSRSDLAGPQKSLNTYFFSPANQAGIKLES